MAWRWRVFTDRSSCAPTTNCVSHTQTSPSAPVCAVSLTWEHISIVKYVCRWVSSVTAEIRDRGGKKHLIRLGRKRLMVSRGMNNNQPHLLSLSQCHYHQLSNYSHYDYLFSHSSLSHIAASFTTYFKSTTTDVRRLWRSSITHSLFGLLRLRSSRTTLQLKIMKRRCSWI